jgi:hypothetical protein
LDQRGRRLGAGIDVDGTGPRWAEFLHASMLDFVTGWAAMSKILIIGLLLGICFWTGLGLLAYLVLL